MKIPTVHLNGTSKAALLSELHDAHTLIQAAQVALGNVTVHGRDYYPQGPEAYAEARAEMDARKAKLESVRQDIYSMYQTIAGEQP